MSTDAAWSLASERWSKGWARRPKRGESYGEKYIKRYEADVKDTFEAGERSSGKKKSPAAMLEELERRYPRSFDLPREHEIRQEVSRLPRLKSSGGAPSTKRNLQQMNGKHEAALEQMLDEDLELKPKAALQRMHETFGGNFGEDGFPTENQVRGKFSNLKRQRKKLKALIEPGPGNSL